MGTSQRKEAVSYFSDVATNPHPPPDADWMQHLSLYHAGICSGCELFSVAEPIVQSLADHAETTGRVSWLLACTTKSLDQMICNATGGSEAQRTVLHLTELTLRHLLRITKGHSSLLLRVMHSSSDSSHGGASPAPQAEDDGAGGDTERTLHDLRQLCSLLIDYAVKVPLTRETAAAHAEVMRLLLTMTSSALHHSPASPDEGRRDALTEMLLSSPQLEALLRALLRRLVDWSASGTPPVSSPTLYAAGQQPSLRNLYNFFSGGGGEANRGASGVPPMRSAKALKPSCTCATQVYRHSAMLLAVLVSHRKGYGDPNPALMYVKSLTHKAPFDLKVLLAATTNKLSTLPALCVVLYVLLYDHPTFLFEVIPQNADGVMRAVQQILQLTYHTCLDSEVGVPTKPEPHPLSTSEAATLSTTDPQVLTRLITEFTYFSYPYVLFMTSTLLLVLSQDRVVNQLACDTVGSPPFTLSTYSGTLSVSALTLVVLCVGITKALNDGNAALVAIFMPCMANIAPFVHDIDAYTAQRLVLLVVMLLKKVQRIELACQAAQMAHDGKPDDASVSLHGDEAERRELQELGAMCLHQLSGLVEAVESMLRGPARNNESLIYELLYHREKLIGSWGREDADELTQQATRVLSNIKDMIECFEGEIATRAPGADNPQEILEMIRKGNNGDMGVDQKVHPATTGEAAPVAKPPAGGAADLVYAYEESPRSYDFFGPFVWATLLSDARRPGGVLWSCTVAELELFPQ